MQKEAVAPILSDNLISVEYDSELNLPIININSPIALKVNGSIEIITDNNDIHLDSINGKIMLNSRQGSLLKNKPESIEYLENVKKDQIQMRKKHTNINMMEILSEIETKVLGTDRIKNYLKNNN